mgnify:FL=1|jgi:hypothetical protein
MKESTLLEMQNKIKAITNVIQGLMNELDYLRTLSIGTLETIKQMPDYEEALGKVKEKANKEKEDGVKQQDTK